MNKQDKIFEEFTFSTILAINCPSCEGFGFAVSMTNKSVKITCNKCHRTFFYRRIENI